ncbi:LOB domain-containing protein 4-like protein [Tanacetum coccineum]|uniref:LOB domain-containing protein 4-like protein n=1 Tax=Tanacetum coccineum TaxID=301880 RepID=A0ABQ5GIV3_9ASTR
MKDNGGSGGAGRKQGAASPCAACKLLRRRCSQDCVFAPYFPADEPHKFASVHKVFGASNVNKMLQCHQYKLVIYLFHGGRDITLLSENHGGDAKFIKKLKKN